MNRGEPDVNREPDEVRYRDCTSGNRAVFARPQTDSLQGGTEDSRVSECHVGVRANVER